MNSNLLLEIINFWSNLIEYTNILEKTVQEQTQELTDIKAQLHQETIAHQKTQETVKDYKNQLYCLFEKTFQFIGLLQPDGILVEANQTALDFGGLTREDVIGKPFWEVRWWTISSETQETLKQAIAQAARGEFVRYQMDVLGAGDRVITIDFSLTPITDDTGQVIFLIAEGHNINDMQLRERMQAIFDASFDGIAIVDDYGQYLEVNPAICQLLGVERSQLIGQNFAHFVAPDHDFQPIWDNFQHQKELSHLLPVLNTDGNCRYTECLAKANVLQGQHLIILRDIIELRDEERRLKLAQERLNYLLNNSPAVIYSCLLTENFETSFISDNVTEILGYQKEEFIQDPDFWVNHLHPDERESILHQIHQISEQTPITVQYRFRKKDGTYQWIQDCMKLMVNCQSNSLEIIGYFIDVNDYKKAQEALRLSEERLQLALEASGDGLWDWNISTDEAYLSSRWLKMLGYDVNETPISFRTWKSLIHPEDKPRVMEIFNSHLKDNSVPYDFDYRVRTKSGYWKWISNYGKVVAWDQNGNPVRMVGIHKDISDRKLTEETLQENERQLRQFLEAIPMAIIVLDNTRKLSYVNSMASAILGKSLKPELRTDEVSQFYQIYQAGTNQLYDPENLLGARALQGENTYKDDIEIRRDNKIIAIEAWGKPIFDNEGNVVYGLVVGNDITERKKAEKTLQESEQQLRQFLEGIPLGVSVVNKNGDIVYKNYTSKKLVKVPKVDELKPENFSKVCHLYQAENHEFYPWPNLPVVKALMGEHSYANDILVRHDDKFIYTESWGTPIFDSEGNVAYGLVVCNDITERRKAEEILQENEQQLRKFLGEMPLAVSVFNKDGKCIYTNELAKKLFKTSGLKTIPLEKSSEILHLYKRGTDEFYPWKDVPIVQSLKGKNVHTTDVEIRKEEQIINLECWGTPIFDSEGDVIYAVVVCNDITERKKAEKIRLALEKQKDISQIQSQFFSMASHELRTPLTGIIMISQLLLSETAKQWAEDKKIRKLKQIESSANKIKYILEKVFVINKAETGNLDFNPQPLALREFCQGLMEEIRLQITTKHILNFVIKTQLDTIVGDQILLNLSLTNLLGNAIKYSPNGGKISLQVTEQTESFIFEIQDQGMGIDLSENPDLFAPFYRGRNVENIMGSGLGLTVVKKCVDRHGGMITVTSEIGVGTTFIVSFPKTPFLDNETHRE